MSLRRKITAAVLAVLAWGVVQIAVSQVAGFQAERAVLSVESLGPVCASVLLTPSKDGTRARPVSAGGGYVVEPWGGGAEVAVSYGVVIAHLRVLRGERVVREADATVRAGETATLRAGLL